MLGHLDELLRQRKLLTEHLAWLDREISRARGTSPAESPIPSSTSAQPGVSGAIEGTQLPHTTPTLAPEAEKAAETILEQYQDDSANPAKDARRGCFILFWGALGTVVILAIAAHFIYKKYRMPLLDAPQQVESTSSTSTAKPPTPPKK